MSSGHLMLAQDLTNLQVREVSDLLSFFLLIWRLNIKNPICSFQITGRTHFVTRESMNEHFRCFLLWCGSLLFLQSLLFICSSGDQSQGFAHIRHIFCHWAMLSPHSIHSCVLMVGMTALVAFCSETEKSYTFLNSRKPRMFCLGPLSTRPTGACHYSQQNNAIVVL